MAMTAGPMHTMYTAGNTQKTRGNTSFTPTFFARSSARCRRLVRDVSAWVRSALAKLVKNR